MPTGPPPAHAAGWVTDQMGTQNLHKVRRKINEQTLNWSPHPLGAERSPPVCWPWLNSAQPPKLCYLLRRIHMAWAQCLQVDQLALSHPSCDPWKWAALSMFGNWIISLIASTCPWRQAFQRKKAAPYEAEQAVLSGEGTQRRHTGALLPHPTHSLVPPMLPGSELRCIKGWGTEGPGMRVPWFEKE